MNSISGLPAFILYFLFFEIPSRLGGVRGQRFAPIIQFRTSPM